MTQDQLPLTTSYHDPAHGKVWRVEGFRGPFIWAKILPKKELAELTSPSFYRHTMFNDTPHVAARDDRGRMVVLSSVFAPWLLAAWQQCGVEPTPNAEVTVMTPFSEIAAERKWT